MAEAGQGYTTRAVLNIVFEEGWAVLHIWSLSSSGETQKFSIQQFMVNNVENWQAKIKGLSLVA